MLVGSLGDLLLLVIARYLLDFFLGLLFQGLLAFFEDGCHTHHVFLGVCVQREFGVVFLWVFEGFRLWLVSWRLVLFPELIDQVDDTVIVLMFWRSNTFDWFYLLLFSIALIKQFYFYNFCFKFNITLFFRRLFPCSILLIRYQIIDRSP